MVDAFGAHDGGAVLEIVDRVVEAGHDPRRFAEDLLERLRDLIVLNAVPDAGEKGLLDVPVDVLERMSRQSAQLGRAELTRAADIVNTGLTEMRGATAPRLLLELICARVLLPAAGDDEASLLVRLERLERRFAIAGDAVTTGPPAVSRAAAVASAPATAAPAPQRLAAPAAPLPEPAPPEPRPPRSPSPAAAVRRRPPLATGDLDAAAVRRIWDDVLEVAKRLKRRTHALLLSGPAQVVDVRANVLVVGFASGPVERQFNTGDNVDILQVALKEVFGVDWRIETTLSGPAATAAATDEDRIGRHAAGSVTDAERVDGGRSRAFPVRGCPRRGGRAQRTPRATRRRGRRGARDRARRTQPRR